jgi:hypothetical protein
MTNFRIVQTQLLSEPLPYEVEKLTRVWYLPRPVWRPVKEQFVQPFTFKPAVKRFQTPREAGLYIEHFLAVERQQKAAEKLRVEEQLQMQKLPRIVQEFNATMLG